MAIDNCNNCPHRILTTKNVTKKIYHNEKNRYGYRPMLKSNALKLFMLLHFYHPGSFWDYKMKLIQRIGIYS